MISKEKKIDKIEQKKIKEKIENALKELKFYMPNEGKRYRKLNKEEPIDKNRSSLFQSKKFELKKF